MKLRISYFNSTAFQKNITRFAPAWALYLIAELLVIINIAGNSGSYRSFTADMGYSLQAMGIISMCYALLVGLLLFGDLFNSRMCNALHAMPMRREGWFLTNVASGLIFSVGPNAVGALLASVMMGQYWYIAFLWLLISTLQYLFFFGVVVFSAYCTGSRFAMALVYGLINFLSILAYWLVYTFYEPALYGITVDTEPFFLFCPCVQMVRSEYIDFISNGVTNSILQINWNVIAYSAICAAIGLVFMGIGLLIYRRRDLECAGDFITVKALKPVFLVLYTLCAGAAVYLFFQLFTGDEIFIFMIIGVVVGYFTGKMLLDRSLRVFNKRSCLGLAGFAVLFAVSILLAQIDPLGITRWTPNADSVESVAICSYYDRYQLYEGDETDVKFFSDSESIENILKVHRHGIENRNEDSNGFEDIRIQLVYRMKNGSVVCRYYYIDVHTEAGNIINDVMSTPEYVLGVDAQGLNQMVKDIRFINLSDGTDVFDDQDIQSLMNAIYADCQAGTMAQHYSFHRDNEQVCWINFSIEYTYDYYYREITVYDNCVNTIQWLKNYGYEFDPWFVETKDPVIYTTDPIIE